MSIDVQKIELLRLCTNFREMILSLDQKNKPSVLKDFPIGSCGITCILLSQYIEDNTKKRCLYVAGEKSDGFSHAWLVVGKFIVDITADQFLDCSQQVIVTKNSMWHKQFKKINSHIVNIDAYQEQSFIYWSYYNTILSGK